MVQWLQISPKWDLSVRSELWLSFHQSLEEMSASPGLKEWCLWAKDNYRICLLVQGLHLFGIWCEIADLLCCRSVSVSPHVLHVYICKHISFRKMPLLSPVLSLSKGSNQAICYPLELLNVWRSVQKQYKHNQLRHTHVCAHTHTVPKNPLICVWLCPLLDYHC